MTVLILLEIKFKERIVLSYLRPHFNNNNKKAVNEEVFKGTVKYWSGITVGIRASLDITQLLSSHLHQICFIKTKPYGK